MQSFKPTIKINKEQIPLINHIFLINQDNDHILQIASRINDKIFENYKLELDLEFKEVSLIEESTINELINSENIIIHLLNTEKKENIYISFNIIMARQILSELLSTSLFNNYDGLKFSTTEKGLFSFICARMLYDLRKDFLNIPPIKILGIYNKNDEAEQSIHPVLKTSLNFIIKDKKNNFLFNAIVEKKNLGPNTYSRITENNLYFYEDIISDTIKVNITTLKMTLSQIKGLTLFDVIILSKKKDKNISVNLIWKNLIGLGEVFIQDERYILRITKKLGTAMPENQHQESILDDHSYNNKVMNDLIVEVQVELANHRILLKDLLALNNGSIINLAVPLNTPLKLLVNQKVIAQAKLIDIDGYFGLNIVSINQHEQ